MNEKEGKIDWTAKLMSSVYMCIVSLVQSLTERKSRTCMVICNACILCLAFITMTSKLQMYVYMPFVSSSYSKMALL